MGVENIIINDEYRRIVIPESESLFGVYSDKNVERKYFRSPRIVGDGIDLSECYILINYVNSAGEYGQYVCDDVTVDGDSITFSWLLSGNVFGSNTSGDIYFAVQAKRANDDGSVSSVFNTKRAVGHYYETVEAGEQISEQYADVIFELMTKVDNVQAALDNLEIPSSGIEFEDVVDGETFEIDQIIAELQLLYHFDFTTGLGDILGSTITATLNGATQSSDGLSIASDNAYAKLGSLYQPNRQIEIEFGEMDAQYGTGAHGRCICIYSNSAGNGPLSEGLIWRKQSQAWAFYSNGAWSDDLPLTDQNAFSGKTVKLVSDNTGYLSLYIDDEYVGTSTVAFTSDQSIVAIGSSSTSYYNMNVKSLKIYG